MSPSTRLLHKDLTNPSSQVRLPQLAAAKIPQLAVYPSSHLACQSVHPPATYANSLPHPAHPRKTNQWRSPLESPFLRPHKSSRCNLQPNYASASQMNKKQFRTQTLRCKQNSARLVTRLSSFPKAKLAHLNHCSVVKMASHFTHRWLEVMR